MEHQIASNFRHRRGGLSAPLPGLDERIIPIDEAKTRLRSRQSAQEVEAEKQRERDRERRERG